MECTEVSIKKDRSTDKVDISIDFGKLQTDFTKAVESLLSIYTELGKISSVTEEIGRCRDTAYRYGKGRFDCILTIPADMDKKIGAATDAEGNVLKPWDSLLQLIKDRAEYIRQSAKTPSEKSGREAL